ncbi:Hypothetical transmembrane protein coupled to NADH-ubiquinone oxidoreductase chain 5 homolog [Alloactinosynnema sp. L-07]|uniref:DUF2309 domain-containing protein n=1 Tax=Alloactinosynnema sp. L-07 TaxID=1653480 RepID=UPI00065F006B|nr:DUF2309 domain-containing protein [Alloactinosynnema sp. L-07]CRK59655.1 Hypothetical transmembrane protein coupled to NADH-ubiquinone oxidoreductase chain 5 homolog [Alloactinosynnema sp. L-07]
MIGDLIDHAAHFLPAQGPLQTFIHHNTLHAFESMAFTDAVVAASRLYGTEPFLPERVFHDHVRAGRINAADIDAVVAAEIPHGAEPIIPGGPNRLIFHSERLRYWIDIPAGHRLRWRLAETDALTEVTPLAADRRRGESTDLTSLWTHLTAVDTQAPTPAVGARPRESLLAETGVDADHLVHPVLIRVTAAFLDQGVAHWSMPGRAGGLLAAFREVYGGVAGPPDRFLRGLSTCLRAQHGWGSERTISWALAELRVARRDWGTVIADTLISLRGWAGMVRHLQERPDSAPVAAPPARLADYLAVQLTLDVFAARHVSRLPRRPVSTPDSSLALAYEAFILAQIMIVDLDVLADPRHAAAWLSQVNACDELTRRRLLHLAYEHRHREGFLGALAAHQRVAQPAPDAEWQAVFCLDEREESMRRHLEEHDPAVETFGAAGFFGVAMRYQGHADVRSRPLCPVVVTPTKTVVEKVVEPGLGSRRRRWRGRVAGARTLGRGTVVTVGLGLWHAAALVGHCLFPRATHRSIDALPRPPKTRLVLEPEFTVEDMAEIVSGLLRTIGLRCSPLVVLVGHGSSSMNNPHESAHDCGATGGGRGGPNARAFAAMANHPGVRARLRDMDVVIPDTTWFVGAYHNTADDTMTYFDTDLAPDGALDRARASLATACASSAHERCRRFESASLTLPTHRATAHVHRHSVDISQPRPEYGHATNAVCVVGERSRTRGLFLDRRAFLVSYEPGNRGLLDGLLRAVGPVCAGINLEYYFSSVDPVGYGCGTKLPHNITGLIGVMDGHSSDLRTGLPWQMVEIHEPVRLLLVVRADPDHLLEIMIGDPNLSLLAGNGWIQVVAWNPDADQMHLFADGAFTPYVPADIELPTVDSSGEVYGGRRDHLGFAHVRPSDAVAVTGVIR